MGIKRPSPFGPVGPRSKGDAGRRRSDKALNCACRRRGAFGSAHTPPSKGWYSLLCRAAATGMQHAVIAPKRMVSPKLTLIPEQERAINYRFEIAFVGEGASELVKVVANSEMAEAYKPAAALHNCGSGATLHTDEGTVIFLPPSDDTLGDGDLARLRFSSIERFSDSLPTTRDPIAASNSAAVFVFWRVKPDNRDPQKPSSCSTSERLRDFTFRLSEIKHMPSNLRPYTVIFAFEADDSQEAAITEFVQNERAKMALEFYPDDGEDTLMAAMQELVDRMIRRQAQTLGRNPSSQAGLPKAGSGPRSGICCAVQ